MEIMRKDGLLAFSLELSRARKPLDSSSFARICAKMGSQNNIFILNKVKKEKYGKGEG